MTVDEYLRSLPPPSRKIARKVRAAIHAASPHVSEAVKYAMPAFLHEGSAFLYFGVWKAHVGLYPISALTPALEAKVQPFRATKDTLRFALDAPIPYALITVLARHKLTAVAAKARESRPAAKVAVTKPSAKKKRLPPDPATVTRVRELLATRRGVTEKHMMGNLAFFLDGTMCCTVGHDGMLIRVTRADREALLKGPAVTPMTMGARTMQGFVRIAPAAYRTRASLARWVERGCSAARTRA